LYNTESNEALFTVSSEHTQGVNDLAFIHNDHEFATVSSDRTTRIHKIDFEGATLEHKSVHNISDFDSAGYTENVEK